MSERIDYPVTPGRRRVMVFNVIAHCVAATLAIWLWRDGAGVAWLFFAMAVCVLAVWTIVILISRPVVARIDGRTISVFGPTGRETSIEPDDVTEATLDPTRRTGVITHRSNGKDDFVIVSLRFMGVDGATDFAQRVADLRAGAQVRA